MKRRKPVVCITTGQVYPSIAKAAADLDVVDVCITNCLKGRQKHTGGYAFRLATEEEIAKLPPLPEKTKKTAKKSQRKEG